MPFVFVHGVNTRKNAAYEKEVGIRDGFLTDYVGPSLWIAKDSLKLAPHRGNTGVKFRRGQAVISTGVEQTFGAERATLPPEWLNWPTKPAPPSRIVSMRSRRRAL